jgi:hypothetical protein
VVEPLPGERPISPRTKARATGAFWLVVFIAGSLALGVPRGALWVALNKIAALSYVVVTILLFDLLRPVHRTAALVALLFGLAGSVVSLFSLGAVLHVRDLVFFGAQCAIVGALIFRSTFLPRFLGVVMAVAGLGWLTFIAPPLADALTPYNLVPGMIGEGVTLLWLLVRGVDVAKWEAEHRLMAGHP